MEEKPHWAPPLFLLVAVFAGCAASLYAPFAIAHYLWVHL
jgi:hypothetical protein